MNYPHYKHYSQKEKVAQKEKITTTAITKSQQSFGNIYL